MSFCLSFFCHLSFGLSFCLSLFVIFLQFFKQLPIFVHIFEKMAPKWKNEKKSTKWQKMTNKMTIFQVAKIAFFLEALSLFCHFLGNFSVVFHIFEKIARTWPTIANNMTNVPPNDHKKKTGQNWNDKKTTKTWQTKLKRQKNDKTNDQTNDKQKWNDETTQKNDKINIWIISRVWLRVSSKTMESWAQSWRTPTNAFWFFPVHVHVSEVLRMLRKSDARSYEVLHLSRKIILANLKNISDEHVSCTAPAPRHASLQIFWKCPTHAIVFGNANCGIPFGKVRNPLRLPRKNYIWTFKSGPYPGCF